MHGRTYMKRRLYHFVDVALWSSELSGVLGLEVHYEVEVVPHIVLLDNVLVECNILVLKVSARKTCCDRGTRR